MIKEFIESVEESMKERQEEKDRLFRITGMVEIQRDLNELGEKYPTQSKAIVEVVDDSCTEIVALISKTYIALRVAPESLNVAALRYLSACIQIFQIQVDSRIQKLQGEPEKPNAKVA